MRFPPLPRVSRLAAGGPLLSLGLLGVAAWTASMQEPPALPAGVEPLDGIARGHSMAAYAKGFLTQLDGGEQGLATSALDDPERRTWAFGPVRREGIRLDQLSDVQFALLEALLDTALSDEGMEAWHQIRELENVLRKLESTEERVAEHRDPNLYWLRIYGTPAPTETWSWRFEGHHLALHVACQPGTVPTITPFFIGANPLFGAGPGGKGIAKGDSKPAQVDAFTELNASLHALITELDEPTAMAAAPELSGEGPKERPRDIRMGPGQRNLPPASGVERSALSPSGAEALDRLVATYLDLIDPELRGPYGVIATETGEIRFSRWGGTELTEARTWSILTNTFALELATTDGPHHVHALLRDVTRDFGGKPK